jgi:peptidoglycan/LPS O-acetylase OafA/YrhL
MIAFEVQRSPARKIFVGSGAAVLADAGIILAANLWSVPYGLFALPLYGFFFLCVACGNKFFGALSSPAALVLGECSFGMYLLHGIALTLLFTEAAEVVEDVTVSTGFMLLPIVAGLMVFLTSMTFRFIEEPMIRLGADILKRPPFRRTIPA